MRFAICVEFQAAVGINFASAHEPFQNGFKATLAQTIPALVLSPSPPNAMLSSGIDCQLAKLIPEIVPSQSAHSRTTEHLNIETGGRGSVQVQLLSLCLLAKFLPTTVPISLAISQIYKT